MTTQGTDAVSLESILFTEELATRPSRPPDYLTENQALVSLAQSLADSPETILQQLTDTILRVLDCGSAGISLLRQEDGVPRFYWPAISGEWKSYVGDGTPRNFGPCGTVLDRNAPLLFKHVEKVFTYFGPVTPLVEEALLIPFYVAGKAVGTVWAVAHDEKRNFDSEDKRQLESLARFAAAAYKAITASETGRWLSAIVESSDDAIVSKDLNGVVQTWNPGAQKIFGYAPEEIIGRQINLIIPPELQDEERNFLERLRAGQSINHFETVRMNKNGKRVNISLMISPVLDSFGRVVGASKIARDITIHRRAEQAETESLISARLLQVQDEERRRIARELHDGVGQLLAAVGMNISVVLRERSKLSPNVAQRVDESSELVRHVSDEIRTVSYLLHPPLLDEMGLRSALRWYVDGFAERSRIDAKLEISPAFARLPKEHELCLFRIAQECLTNVHRHSKGSAVRVILSDAGGNIVLQVQDNGRGFAEEKLDAVAAGKTPGVGFRGMQERLRQLGGKLEIKSDKSGTIVTAMLPRSEPASASAAAKEVLGERRAAEELPKKPLRKANSKTNASRRKARRRSS
jgi:PAS domain S-box-containing protein